MMRYLVLAATLVAAVAAAAPAASTAAADADAASTGPAATISLDAKTFDEKVSFYADDEWLLEFYAPWCTHCQHFAPTYDKIARTLDAVGKRVAKIDCVASKPVCTRFGVSAFPTIKLVRGSGLKADAKNPKAQALSQEGRRVYDFSGERTLEGVVAWVQNGYASATSDVFPKPGEAIESAGSISKLILAHPYLSGTVLAVVVVLLVFFIYIMCDSMRDEEEEARAIAKARAEKDAAKAQRAADIHAAAASEELVGGAPAAAANGTAAHSNGDGSGNGNGHSGAAAASPKRRTQRAD